MDEHAGSHEHEHPLDDEQAAANEALRAAAEEFANAHEAEAPEQNGQAELPPMPEPAPAVTAFLVMVNSDGKALAYSDINTPVRMERMASLDDMYGACAQVMRDVQILQTSPIVAQQVINAQMQVAEQIKQQKLGQKLIEKGMRLPPH